MNYALFTILGSVTSAPEVKEWNGSEFVSFTVKVLSPDGNGGTFVWRFEVSVFGDKLTGIARTLLPGQGVQVVGNLESKENTGKNGVYFNYKIRARFLVPGVMPASAASGSGVASPQRQQQGAHPSTPQGGYAEAGGGNYGRGTYTPPTNGREAAQMPHEDEDDIPF